jgi:hypothetical protein
MWYFMVISIKKDLLLHLKVFHKFNFWPCDGLDSWPMGYPEFLALSAGLMYSYPSSITINGSFSVLLSGVNSITSFLSVSMSI